MNLKSLLVVLVVCWTAIVQAQASDVPTLCGRLTLQEIESATFIRTVRLIAGVHVGILKDDVDAKAEELAGAPVCATGAVREGRFMLDSLTLDKDPQGRVCGRLTIREQVTPVFTRTMNFIGGLHVGTLKDQVDAQFEQLAGQVVCAKGQGQNGKFLVDSVEPR